MEWSDPSIAEGLWKLAGALDKGLARNRIWTAVQVREFKRQQRVQVIVASWRPLKRA